MRTVIALAFASALSLGCSQRPLQPFPSDNSVRDTTAAPAAAQSGALLSAFYGLQGTMPVWARLALCTEIEGGDGMPIVFGRTIDPATLQAGDVKVITASRAYTPTCLTMAPAVDAGELRTALLLGKLGTPDDPPLRVEIVGHVLSDDGAVDFRGARVDVTPLADGPSIVLAEIPPRAQWKLGVSDSDRGVGDGCPEGTAQVVRTVWAGGVTKPGGDEIDDVERQAYRVRARLPDGTETTLTPDAIGDRGDGDNYHLLCFRTAMTPLSVSFPVGLMTDPNEDLNPATEVSLPSP